MRLLILLGNCWPIACISIWYPLRNGRSRTDRPSFRVRALGVIMKRFIVTIIYNSTQHETFHALAESRSEAINMGWKRIAAYQINTSHVNRIVAVLF